jgi:single-strand DNA-binding protein
LWASWSPTPNWASTPTGATAATFTFTFTGHCYDPDTGQWIDEGATFLPCSICHHAAENVAESLSTGAHVLVTGTLRQREWETTDVDKRHAYQIDATEVGVSLK